MTEKQLSDKDVFVPIVLDMLQDKQAKVNILNYLYSNSIYKVSECVRAIPKDEVVIRDMSQIIKINNSGKPTTRQTFSKYFNYLLDGYDNIIKFDKDKNEYVLLSDMKSKIFTVGLPHKTLKTLYSNFSDLFVKMYFYLLRQDIYWRTYRGTSGFNFTITQLCEALGYSSTNKVNRDTIKDTLRLLAANQLIEYLIVAKGAVYYRRLLGVNSEFILKELVTEIEETVIKDYEESESVEPIEVEDKILANIGGIKCDFVLASGEQYNKNEIVEQLDFRSQSWWDSNFFSVPGNREKAIEIGLDKKFPKNFS